MGTQGSGKTSVGFKAAMPSPPRPRITHCRRTTSASHPLHISPTSSDALDHFRGLFGAGHAEVTSHDRRGVLLRRFPRQFAVSHHALPRTEVSPFPHSLTTNARFVSPNAHTIASTFGTAAAKRTSTGTTWSRCGTTFSGRWSCWCTCSTWRSLWTWVGSTR